MANLNMSITVKGQTYELPEISTEQYLEYCDVRDTITADGKVFYTRKDFNAMAEQLAKLYGNQFTRAELLSNDGIKLGEVLARFSAMESVLMEQVNASVEALRANFTNGT